MKSDLAERLLKEVMDWSTAEFIERVRDLQVLAAVKYDEYGNYRPGSKFVENLAGWLNQFPKERRRTALDFVLKNLVFVSEVEMNHLISLVYPEVIEPALRARIAKADGISEHRIAEIRRQPSFASLRRRSLIIGASDGARLDRLRRSSTVLSHEQFFPGTSPTPALLKPMTEKIIGALGSDAQPSFAHVFLVDDFAGSGRTLLRRDKEEVLVGKLGRLRELLEQSVEAGFLDDVQHVTVILYCASQQSIDHLERLLPEAGLDGWDIGYIQLLPEFVRVDRQSPEMTQLCHDFFDPDSEDAHKGATPIGYSDCALPLVLSHNTPNNSICLLWMDTSEGVDGQGLAALFPRYERHHPDRP